MPIQKYINFDKIDSFVENEGQRIQPKDLFIMSKNEKEETDFGDCKNDVLEVSVYDINNNLLPQKDGKFVAYIKMPDIKTYVYNITNAAGQRELAINVEKLLNAVGFFDGIYKINLNFVKNKVGSDNDMQRVWIQEVSPTRQEIRILPLTTNDIKINDELNYQFNNILNLSKTFSIYRNSILNFFSSSENEFQKFVKSFIENVYGAQYFVMLEKTFGISKFDDLTKRIYNDFKTSVGYYLTNKNYTIGDTNYGKPSEMRFESCEVYEFTKIIDEIKKILYDCIFVNTSFLQRRDPTIKRMSKEFGITTLRKEVKDNLDSFEVNKHKKRNVYNPKKVDVKWNEEKGKYEYNYKDRDDEENLDDEDIRMLDVDDHLRDSRDVLDPLEVTSSLDSDKNGDRILRHEEQDWDNKWGGRTQPKPLDLKEQAYQNNPKRVKGEMKEYEGEGRNRWWDTPDDKEVRKQIDEVLRSLEKQTGIRNPNMK